MFIHYASALACIFVLTHIMDCMIYDLLEATISLDGDKLKFSKGLYTNIRLRFIFNNG